MEIREYEIGDLNEVIELWNQCGLVRFPNDPVVDIALKLEHNDGLMLVGIDQGFVVSTAMAGFDGHRGWLNYLAVTPQRQKEGLGEAMLNEVERRLAQLDCRN